MGGQGLTRITRRTFLVVAGAGVTAGGAAIALLRTAPGVHPPAPPGQRSRPWEVGGSFEEELDTLFMLRSRSAAEVLAEGAFLTWDVRGQSTRPQAPLVAGPHGGGGFGSTADGLSMATFPLDGILGSDAFTIEFQLRPEDLDFVRQPTGQQFFVVLGQRPVWQLAVSRPSADVLEAKWDHPLGAPPFNARLQVSEGQIRPGAWTPVAVTYDGNRLRLFAGTTEARAHNGASPGPTYPWSGDELNGSSTLGINGLGRPGKTAGNWSVSEVHLRRFARTPGATVALSGPTVDIDASRRLGPWPGGIPGIVGHWTGNYFGPVPLPAKSEPRDTLIDLTVGRGMRMVRAPGGDLASMVAITDRSPAGGPVEGRLTYDWTALDAWLEPFHRKGADFHLNLGYNIPAQVPGPRVFGGHNRPDPPRAPNEPSPFSLFARFSADAVSHLVKDRGFRVRSIGFWNEPSGGTSTWSGTVDDFSQCWVACARAVAALKLPGLNLGGPDELWMSSPQATADRFQKAVIDAAAANHLPLPALNLHEYSANIGAALRHIDDMRAYARERGFPDVRVNVTEWNWDGVYGADADHPGSAAATQPDLMETERNAAFAFAFMADLVAHGATDFATFFKMGAFAPGTHTGWAARLGMFSGDTPPRPWSVAHAFEAMTMLSGDRLAAKSNWPWLRALASSTTGDKPVLTAVVGTYRPWRAAENVSYAINWSGLPARFDWTQWRLDRSTRDAGGLVKVAAGNQGDLPRQVTVLPLSVSCFQLQAR